MSLMVVMEVAVIHCLMVTIDCSRVDAVVDTVVTPIH
jgi:hypothetical protein